MSEPAENSSALLHLLKRMKKLYSGQEDKSEVVVNKDSPASQFSHAAFDLKDIGAKWLIFSSKCTAEKPAKDRGPMVALNSAMASLKNMYYLNNAAWETVRAALPISVGLVKATSDCGNSSVSMGLASIYFLGRRDGAVAFLNCGTGGVRFQLYIKTGGKIMCLLEYKPSPEIGRMSNLQAGNFLPSQPCSAEVLVSEIKQGLASAPWLQLNVIKKLKKTFGADMPSIPVYAFVTGKIRNYWEAKEKEEIETAVNRVFELVGGVKPFSEILFSSPSSSSSSPSASSSSSTSSYLISQVLEGAMELSAVRALYAQFSQVVNRKLEPVISLGVGRGSSQWTTLNPEFPDDFRQYVLTPLKYGMDDEQKLAEGLPTAIYQYCYQNSATLVRLMESVVQRGNIPVIALKSGCLIPLDDAKAGGKALRTELCETNVLFKRMRDATVQVGRKNSTLRRSYDLCTISPSVACAEVGKYLIGAEEDPRPDFVAIQKEGSSEFLSGPEALDLVAENDVLIFYTATDLRGESKSQPSKEVQQGSDVPDNTVKFVIAHSQEQNYCSELGCFEYAPCSQHLAANFK